LPNSQDTAQRKILQTGAAYVAATLAIWGALDLAINAFTLPAGVLRAAMIASIIGFPFAIAFAWFVDRRGRLSGAANENDGAGPQLKGLALGAVAAAICFAILLTTTDMSNESDEEAAIVSSIDRAAIAVMPFENLSDDGRNAHFADGIADDVATSLQGWGVFPVISRSATRSYRGRTLDILDVAKQLGVRYLLVGSVRTSGDTIRVSAQLVDGESNAQLWAGRFESTTTDIFAIQDEITEKIVTAIAPEMTRDSMRLNVVGRPAELATWELFMRAQGLIVNSSSYDEAIEARSLVQAAIDREPGYAAAYTLLAEISHDMSGIYSSNIGDKASSAELDKALEYARSAVRLNPMLVDARVWLGHLLMHHRDIDRGVVELREAVRLNPSHARAHAELGFGLAIDGSIDEAFDEFERSSELSPNDPRSIRIKTFKAFGFLYAGRYEEAASISKEIIDSDRDNANNIWPYIIEVSALVRQGKLDNARVRVNEFEQQFGDLDWPGIERGAWSQEELDLVKSDLQSVGMVGVIN
jgi:TolB-like protein